MHVWYARRLEENIVSNKTKITDGCKISYHVHAEKQTPSSAKVASTLFH